MILLLLACDILPNGLRPNTFIEKVPDSNSYSVEIVSDIESYPLFLPWVSKAKIHSKMF